MVSMLETLGLRNAEPQDAGHEASILSRGIGLREPQCSVPTDSDRLSPGSYFYGSRSPLGPPGDAASGAVMDPVTLRMHYARFLASRQWTEIALSLCHAGRVGTTDPC